MPEETIAALFHDVNRNDKASNITMPLKKDTRDKNINQRISESILQIYYLF
ncbi:hypothetical protein [Niabella aquatica]